MYLLSFDEFRKALMCIDFNNCCANVSSYVPRGGSIVNLSSLNEHRMRLNALPEALFHEHVPLGDGDFFVQLEARARIET